MLNPVFTTIIILLLVLPLCCTLMRIKITKTRYQHTEKDEISIHGILFVVRTVQIQLRIPHSLAEFISSVRYCTQAYLFI